MLQKIRDNIQGLFAKIFIGFVIAVFALFGVETIVGTFINQPAVTKVNGEEITEFELTNETQRKYQELIENMGDDFDPDMLDEVLVRQMALEDLIQQELLRQAATKAGMAVSPRTIDRQIASIPDFQLNGVFSPDLAQAVLAGSGISPSAFRASLANQILLNQMRGVYAGSAFVTEAEMRQIAALTQQSRDLRYVLLTPGEAAMELEVSDEEIQAYYSANEQQFMREEQVIIEYVLLDKNELSAQANVSERQIENRFQEMVDAAMARAERRASHILLEAFSDNEFAAAEALAEELKERIDAGESFETLAAEYSDDLGSAEFGGDVGYTSGDSFVDEFEAALAALSLDEVSGPVRTEFGVHLIKLTEAGEVELPTLEDRREDIIRELSSTAVENRYLQLAQQLGNMAFESLDLEGPAEALELEIQTAGPFGRSGGIGVAANRQVIDQAFSFDVLDGLNSELVSLDNERSLVLRLLEHNPPALRPLEEVSAEIDIILRNEKANQLVVERGERLIEALDAGQGLEDMAEEGLSWTETAGVQRDSMRLERELLERVFDMGYPEEGESLRRGFLLDSGNYAIVELQRVVPGDLDAIDEQNRFAMHNFLMQQNSALDFNSFLANLRENADIVNNLANLEDPLF